MRRGIEVIENIIKNQGYGKEIYGKIDSAYNFIDNPTSQGFEQFHHNLIDIVHSATEYNTRGSELRNNAAEQMKQKPTLGTRVKRAAAKVMLIGAFLGLGKQAAAQNKQPYTEKAKAEYSQTIDKELTTSEIERLMKKENAYDIMKPYIQKGLITDFKHDERNPKRSLDKLHRTIYSSDKPVLVLYYNSLNCKNKGDLNSMREAIIFNELSKKYINKMNFLAYDARNDTPKGVRGIYHIMGDIMKKKYGYFIRGPPSIAMFSKWDVTKGETPEKNDGNMKHIDTQYKGPSDIKILRKWMKNFPSYWIEPLLTKPNGKYAYLFRNTDSVNKVKY